MLPEETGLTGAQARRLLAQHGPNLLVPPSRRTGGFWLVLRTFADPIVPGSDFITHTEESYLAYTAPAGQWGLQFGRNRWHWGPGEEASLLLSKTSAPLSDFYAALPIVHSTVPGGTTSPLDPGVSKVEDLRVTAHKNQQ